MFFSSGHTHDRDLEVSRSQFEIALYQGWQGRLTWYEMDMSWPSITMALTLRDHGGVGGYTG